MRYDAVIFDLFGTLVDNPAYLADGRGGWDGMMGSVADALGIEFETYRRVWSETEDQRYIGIYSTVEEYLEHVCQCAGVPVRPEGIGKALAIRQEYFRAIAWPREDTLRTLTHLRRSGYKIGLISDCVLEDAQNWPRTLMAPLVDAAVLSCEVGLRKPDPRIYQLVCDQLGVGPADCLYVGDGGSGELTGAVGVGMDAVLIRAPYDTNRGDREDWRGVSIAYLEEVLKLVEAGQ
jgi:putative hydrolase of the HAD superfamily